MRTILVGDVHGCAAELRQLLDRVHFATGDRLVLVGDMIARGPDSLGVMAVVRETGALFVLGNHEERVLRCANDVTIAPNSEHNLLARALPETDLALLRSAPLTLSLPEHGVVVLHAGMRPPYREERQDEIDLLTLREHDGRLWGEAYPGPEHVVFGHHAMAGLQLHPYATGLDTGCVYGRELTALVLEYEQPVPTDLRHRRALMKSVRASRPYFQARRKES